MSTLTQVNPNAPSEIQKRASDQLIGWVPTLGMLVARGILFVAFQATFAFIFYAWGNPDSWDASAVWWMLAATLANIVCIVLLVELFQQEGMRYREILRVDRAHIGRDLLITLGVFVVTIPIAWLPSIAAGTVLFGDAAKPLDLLIRPVAFWGAILLLFLFPITQGLAELPTYFGYVTPRLGVLSGKPWLALVTASFFLAAQHCALPLLFDGRFIAWRLLMFLPFALFVGLALKWRPQLMPYLVVGHMLIDLPVAWMVLSASG